jgi:hypothetical protein
MEGKSDYQKKEKDINLVFLIFIIIMVSVVIIIIYPAFYDVCHDSINDLLTTLIQIEVVILTIFISLSIVLIQLTVTSYSSRVAKIYQKDIFLLFIYISYILIIIASLTYLKSSNVFYPNNNTIIVLYGLGILYISIIPVSIYRLYEILKPEKIIEKILREITLEKIISEKSDCILLMIDFLRGSFLKHDSESIREGLDEMNMKFEEVIGKVNDNNLVSVADKIFSGLKSYCTFLLMQQDIEIISKTLNKYHETAKYILDKNEIQDTSSNKKIDKAGEKIIGNLKSIAELAIRKYNEEGMEEINSYLKKLGKISIKRNLKNTLKEILEGYKYIWKQTRKRELCDLSRSIISYMSNLAGYAIRRQNCDSLKRINSYLVKIAISSIENDYGEDLKEIISTYENIFNEAIWRSIK